MDPQAEVPWHQQDFNWNPFRLIAAPACEGPPAPVALPQVSAAAAAAAGFSMRYNGSGLAPFTGLDTALDPRSHRARSSTVCQVEGCSGSLKNLKEYHQRYKICEHHLKVSSIVVEGVRKRFCQQCGRFHDLSEFDGDKRSCRARLQRHNARRRKKADTDSALKVAVTSRKPSGSRRQSSSPTSREGGGGIRAAARHSSRQIAALLQDNAAAVAHQQLPPLKGGLLGGELEGGQHPLGLANGIAPLSAPMGGQHGGEEEWGPAGSAARARAGQKPANLENALSELLSDSQARHQGSAVSLEAIQEFLDDGQRHNGQLPLAVPYGGMGGGYGMPVASGFDGPGPGFGGLPMSSSLPNGSDLWSMRKQAFQTGGNTMSLPLGMGLSGNPNMGFSSGMVMPGGGGSSGASPARLNGGLHSMGSAPLPLDFKAEPQGSGLIGGGRLPPPNGVRSLSDQSVLGGSGEEGAPAPMDAMSVLHEARALLSGGGGGPRGPDEFSSHTAMGSIYPSQDQLVRLAAKVYNCTPEQLPVETHQTLASLLSCGVNGMTGSIRPGCTHLTVDAVLTHDKASELRRSGVRVVTQALLAGPNGSFWSQRSFTLQLFDEVALVRYGRLLHVLSIPGSEGVYPSVLALAPRFTAGGKGADGPLLALTGAHLAGQDAAVLARCQGSFLPLRTVARVPAAEGVEACESVVVQLPVDVPQGALQLEVTRGGCLSGAVSALVLPSAQAADELRGLEHAGVRGEELEGVILDMDRVLQYDALLQASVAGAPPPTPARVYSPEDVAALSACAQKLLILACEQGWPAVAATVMPVACAAAETVGDVMEALQGGCAAGLTPLHLAVRTGSAELVQLLLEWASMGGYEWSINVAGPRGITPLHLAALLPDHGAIAKLLTEDSPASRAAWFTCGAEDGSTPADFASARVNQHVQDDGFEMHGAGMEPPAGELSANDDVMGGDQEEEAETSPAASSGMSSESFVEEMLLKPFKHGPGEAGQRGKEAPGGLAMPPRLYEDYYMDCDTFNLAFAPTVFDRSGSVVTASVILLVGGATLLLRHCVDVLAL